MKAFLSHSSTDKPFVEEVGKLLGRQHYLIDRQQFDVGQDFKSEIVRCLAVADTLVLFASEAALKSPWVTYEMDISENNRIHGILKDALVFLLGDVSHSDLPPWLQKGLVMPAAAPKAVARDIAKTLDKRLGATRSRYFFGRGNERNLLEEKLNPIGGDLPRVIALWGLPGIGRKTLMEDTARNLLQYKHFVIVDVESGDNLSDLAFKLAAQFEFYKDVPALKALGEQIRSEDQPVLLARLESYLSQSGDRTFLTFVDFGGLVDNDGNATDICRAILDIVAKDNGLYLGLVLRRPLADIIGPHSAYSGVVREHVKALHNEDVERLLVKVLSDRKIKFETKQLKSLAEYVRGYPPAAYYAADLAEHGGLDLLLSEPRPMINFRSRILSASLNGVDKPSPNASILEVLAFYSPLPLGVIGESTGLTAAPLADALRNLLDSSILEIDSEGFFLVSEPLVESAQNMFDRWKVPHARIAKALENFIKEVGVERGGLTLVRGLFRAARLANLDVSDSEMSFPADLVRLTEELYHQREYERAVEIGQHALGFRPENLDARSFVVRALAQLGKVTEAKQQLQKVRELGWLRDFYFLAGFIDRLDGKLAEAIQNYEDALKRGRRGVAIHRDLASCYFHLGNLEKAKEHLTLAQKGSDRINRYVVDLFITIAVASDDEIGAREGLSQLEEVDKPEFFLHRSSTVEFRFGAREKARDLARQAVAITKRPTFAMLSQLIKCEIATYDLAEAASHINEAEHRFGARRRDVLLGLRCKWELANEQFANADAIWQQLSDKDKPVHKALRRDIVEGLLSQVGLGATESAALERELAVLKEAVGTSDWDIYDEDAE